MNRTTRTTRTTRTRAALAALAFAGILAPDPAAQAHTIVGIPHAGGGDHLVQFNGHSPAMSSEIAVTGMAKGEKLVGLDYRTATNQLYGVGSKGFLYTIDITTGHAYPVSRTPIVAALANVEIDFNPVEDRLYIVTAAGAMMMVDPDTAVVQGRRQLKYDPADAAQGALELGGIGFDNNYVGATVTKLLGVDAKRRTLVSIDDAGLVHTIGNLQLGKGELIGFDIGAKPNAELAFSPVNYPGETTVKMYVIKRTTGATTLAGAVGGDHPLTHTTMVPDSFRVYAIDAGSGELITFVSSTPGIIESGKPVTGLAAGEKVVALNFRPQTGELYGLGSAGHLYKIKPTTAAATAVPGAPLALKGTQFGLEFDPAGKARVVSDAMAGLSVDPDTGTATEGSLGGPAAAIAFTNRWAGQTSGTQLALDVAGKQLKVVEPAADGKPKSWPLGVEVTPTAVFVIGTGTGEPSKVSSEIGYAMLQPTDSKGSMLYAIPMTGGLPKLGAAGRLLSPIGLVGGAAPRVVSAMAIMGRTVSFDATSYRGAKTAATGKGLGGIPVSVNLSAPAAVPVTVDYATADGTAKAGSEYEAATGTITFQPGEVSHSILVKPIANAASDGPKDLKLKLSHTTGPAMLAMAGPLFSNVNLADAEVTMTITATATAAAGAGAGAGSAAPSAGSAVATAAPAAGSGSAAASAATGDRPLNSGRLNMIMIILLALAGITTILVVRSTRAKPSVSG